MPKTILRRVIGEAAWDFLRFYSRCVRRAFKGKLAFAQSLTFVVSIIAALIVYFIPGVEGEVSIWLLIIPLSVFGATVAVGLILAPYAEYRDLAKRVRTDEVGAGSAESPILPAYQLFIDLVDDDYDFKEPGTSGHPSSTTGASLSLRTYVGLRALHDTRVESLELEVLSRRIPSSWNTNVAGDILTSIYVYFEIPDWVNPGEHLVRFVAFAGGRWWRSPDYTITFPSRADI